MKKLILASTLMYASLTLAKSTMIPIAESQCQKDYLDLFSKDTITMTVVFGYDDVDQGYIDKKTKKLLYTKAEAKDLVDMAFFVKTLSTPCSKWDQKMCGFKVKPGSPTVLTRRIYGPDGKLKMIKVLADNSAVSKDDKENRKNPLQLEKTKKLQKMFTDGLENSEITVYMGHSRDGGGPSFEPPKLDRNGHVDYDYYHNNKTDRKRMLDALAKDPGKSRIVSLISCSSVRWFQKRMTSVAPATGIIGTNESFYTSRFEQSILWMEDVFSYQCMNKLNIPDARDFADIVSTKKMKIPAKNAAISKQDLDKKTLDELAKSLSSSSVSARKAAFLEIKSYDQSLYSEALKLELKNYSFGNTVKNNM